MSRIARISAIYFVRGKEGGAFVISRRSRILMNPSTEASTGCPAVRCIMVLCQASQQAAHRVGSSESMGIDLVCSMLRGRANGTEETAQDTLLLFSGVNPEVVRRELRATWCYNTKDMTVVIAKDEAYHAAVCGTIDVYTVYNYYGLELEGDDVEDMVELMCYRVEKSALSITTREGMLHRGLGWMETLIACDYTKLPQPMGSTSCALTSTSATMCINFS